LTVPATAAISARACSDEIDAPADVITGLVPVISINRARGRAKRVLAKRCALRIGMAGTSPRVSGTVCAYYAASSIAVEVFMVARASRRRRA